MLKKALNPLLNLQSQQLYVTPLRAITVRNKHKTLRDQFRDSWKQARNNAKMVDYSQEMTAHYKGEFSEYARPFDRYLDENRFKEIQNKKDAARDSNPTESIDESSRKV